VVPKGGGRKYINILLRVMKNILKKFHRGRARTMITCLVIIAGVPSKLEKVGPAF